MDVQTGEILTRFDLSENDAVPSTYPIAVVASKDGKRGFVALWNASEVVELDLAAGKVGRRLPLLKPEGATAPGSHPTALVMAPDGQTLYVALGNRDAVAAIDLIDGTYKLKGVLRYPPPGTELLRRAAGGVGAERRRIAAVCRGHGRGCGRCP